MVFIPALLLFTTLTSVGLAAAWAATSRWHWFVRTMLFLGVAALPLVNPAYEMFVAFVLQGLVVAVGVQAWRWRRRDVTAGKGSRFALRDALLVVVPLAILSAVAVRLPSLNLSTWANVCGIGLFGGGATLIALWVSAGHWQTLLVRGVVGTVATVLLALPGVLWDNALDSTVQQLGWPPERSSPAPWAGADQPGNNAWVAISAVALWSLVALLLLQGATARRKLGLPRFPRRAVSCVCPVFVSIVAAFPLLVLFILANPLPIPNMPPPNPNGFDDYLKATALLPANPIVDSMAFDVDNAPLKQLKSAAAEGEPAIASVRRGLSKSVWKTVNYTDKDLSLSPIADLRTVARLLHAAGRSEEKSGDANGAASAYTDLILYGSSQGRGGLVIDLLVGIACGGIGVSGLHDVRDTVSPDMRRAVIAKLSDAESLLEDIEVVLHRDRVWTQHAYGWHGHLTQFLDDVRGPTWVRGTMETAFNRYRAILRIVRTEYAVLQHRDHSGGLPETLDEIPADSLGPSPVDPFASDGALLRYRRTKDGYLVYSIWVDGRDDEGRAPEPIDGFIHWDPGSPGDLSLDALFHSELDTSVPPDEPGGRVTDGASEE